MQHEQRKTQGESMHGTITLWQIQIETGTLFYHFFLSITKLEKSKVCNLISSAREVWLSQRLLLHRRSLTQQGAAWSAQEKSSNT